MSERGVAWNGPPREASHWCENNRGGDRMKRHRKRAATIAAVSTCLVLLAGCTETSGTPSVQDSAGQAGAARTVMVTQTVTATVTQTKAPPSTAAPTVVTTTVTATSPAGSGAGSWCQVADLDVQLAAGGVAAGSVYRPITFTNSSADPCEIGGFPYVFYMTAENGTRVGSAAMPSGALNGVVTLQPGESAASELRSASDPPGVFGSEACDPVSVTGIQLYVPGNSTPIFVALPDDAHQVGCQTDPSGQSILTVQSVSSS